VETIKDVESGCVIEPEHGAVRPITNDAPIFYYRTQLEEELLGIRILPGVETTSSISAGESRRKNND